MTLDRPGPFEMALLGVDHMCRCRPMPLNYWHHPAAGWCAGRRLYGSTTPRGAADAAEFTTGGYDAWMIRCPLCRLVYAGGAAADLDTGN